MGDPFSYNMKGTLYGPLLCPLGNKLETELGKYIYIHTHIIAMVFAMNNVGKSHVNSSKWQ